jgi:ElaB/YqjD/DUF883 family membrane-anchored ribosome-binding protein
MVARSSGYGWGMRIPIVIVFALVTALAGCTRGDLRELGRETEEALQDAGDALDELVGRAEGPLRDAAEEALDAAAEAREASREFEENPTTETRQALDAAGRRVDDASRELEGLIDRAPEGVRDALQRALDALTEVRQRIQRQLDES